MRQAEQELLGSRRSLPARTRISRIGSGAPPWFTGSMRCTWITSAETGFPRRFSF